MEEKARHELGVGAVFIFGLILLASFAYFANYYGRILRTNNYTLVFDEVAGLQIGADVLLAGTRVGEVLSIEVQPSGKVHVKIGISKKHPLRENYIYTIRSGFLLGKPTVAIHTSPQPGRLLQPGEFITATNPSLPEDVIADVRKALEDTTKSLQEATKLVGDPEIRAAIRTTFSNLSKASENAVTMTAALASTSAKADTQAEEVLNNLGTTARNLAQATSSVEELVSNPALSKNILETAANLRKTTGNLEKIISQPELTQTVETLSLLSDNLNQSAAALSQFLTSGGTLDRASQTIASAQQAAEKLNTVATQLEALATSPEATTGLKQTLSNARAASAGALEAANKANSLLSSAQKVLRPASTLKATGGSQIYFLPEAHRIESDLELRLGSPWFSRWLLLGAQDVGGRTTASLKVGLPAEKNSRLLAGIHRSKLGVGYETDLSRSLGLAVDLYDPNRLQLDLWATYRLLPGLYLGAGAVGLGQDNYFRFGIGLRK